MPSKAVLAIAILFSLLWPFFDMKYHGHFSDAEYEKKVKKLIASQDYYDKDEIVKVRVNDRWVTLSGNIRAEEDKIHLGHEIANIHGIKGVTNLLTPEEINIAALEKLKVHLLHSPQVFEFNYLADSDRVVTLTGHIQTEDMKNDIVELVGKIKGVKNVVDKLSVGPPTKKIEDIIINILRLQNIYFDFNSAKIREESLPSIDKIADVLKKYPDTKITIEGHTDNVGSDAYNQKLSDARAGSVKNALVERGVDATRLTSIGYGESQPIADNDTPEGRSENRRIEFKVK